MFNQIKVGVKQGGGPPPGYQWSVLLCSQAFTDAKFLSKGEYRHVACQVRQLAREDDPTHPITVSVDVVEDVLELRIKGGPLYKKNVRVFFILDKKSIVVLGCIKKETEGQTPKATKRTMSRRRRKYLSGDFSRE